MLNLGIKDVNFQGEKGSVILQDDSNRLYEFFIPKDKACILSLIILGIYVSTDSFYKLLDNLFNKANLTVNAVVITKNGHTQVEVVGNNFCERYWLSFSDALIVSAFYNVPIYSEEELKDTCIKKSWLHLAEEMLYFHEY
jgi:hypothetical protein